MKKIDQEPKPVEKIEINIKHVKLRFFIVIVLVLVVIGVGVYMLVSSLTETDGWKDIPVNSNLEHYNYGDEFYFQYNLGKSGKGATEEFKELQQVYSESIISTSKDLSSYDSYEDVHNVYYINSHINEDIVVSDYLFDALNKVLEKEPNFLYYGPIHSEYEKFLLTAKEATAKSFDPHYSLELSNYYTRVIEKINNGDISISLNQENKSVRLNVNEEYKNLIIENTTENTVPHYIDFGWLKEPLIMDYLYDKLTSLGFIYGYITTYRGCFMNLYKNFNYQLNINNYIDNVSQRSARMTIINPMRGIQFRNFSVYDSYDLYHLFTYKDGVSRTDYINYSDGLDYASIDSLTCYSYNLSLTEIALAGVKVYSNNVFNMESLLSNTNIESVWVLNKQLKYTDKKVEVITLNKALSIEEERVRD